MSATIVLTDPPELVELKREFRILDEQEEQTKFAVSAGFLTKQNFELLDQIRARKCEIARKCFLLGQKDAPRLAALCRDAATSV